MIKNVEGTVQGMKGEVDTINGREMRVKFYSTELTITVMRDAVEPYFESLDLVEVVYGPHRGLRGLVVDYDNGDVSVLDELDDLTIVSDRHQSTHSY